MTGAVTVVQQQQLQPLMMGRADEWSTGICDCCTDMRICCCAVWCYPCFVGSTLSAFNENFALCCFDAGPVSPMSLALRYGVRKKYGIQGSLCDDCFLVYCCNPCSMCQVAREIEKRKMQQPTTVVCVQPANLQFQNPGPSM
ncbi:hypothetical protein ACEWY4_009255 [Coilia grayii]|uniref:Uncharacterized protein n=1 Tax=Coilia grayii TaxID=363190 RepID=A0ABD1K5Y3_9TELE